MMETLHDSAYYVVRAWRGNVDRKLIVLSFSGVDADERGNGTFFGYALARKLDIPWVGIVAKHNNWYRDGDYREALHVAKQWADTRARQFEGKRPDYIGYGLSMGGYAAIKYSALLGLDFIYAMAPQWSIDPHEVGYQSHFQGFYQPKFTGMGIRPWDVRGRVYAFVDPYEKPDVREIREIGKQCKVFDIPVCRAGHMVTQWLKGSKTFEQLLAARHDLSALRRVTASIRKASPDYLGWILRKGYARYPLHLVTILLARITRDAGYAEYLLRTQWQNILPLVASLLAAEETGLAQQILRSIRARYKQPFALSYVMAWDGELLCYDPQKNTFSRTRQHLPRDGVPIVMTDTTLSALTPAGLIPVPLALHHDRAGFFLHDGEGYLSNRPEGSIISVEQALGWEKFYAYSPYEEQA